MIKVKELKEDAIIDVKVNKSFYLMAKNTLYYLFTDRLSSSEEEREKTLAKIMTSEYKDLNDLERSFYTLTLLLAEIESQATKNDLYEEKEILEPDDEGFVPPTM
tara:strand:- start:3175 stop:3489 length:315 start_codon:yes stop_codon:yes gene_type:complete